MKPFSASLPFASRPSLQRALRSAVPWWLCLAAVAPPAAAESGVMYRCPGNDYNNTLGAKEAKDKGCRTLEGAPITVIQSTRPRAASAAPVPGQSSAPAPAGSRVDAAEQRARDSDARRILEGELRREQERLEAMRAEYNNGQPERQGNERNYQKYFDRTADLKAALGRKESDIAALKREIAKHPQ